MVSEVDQGHVPLSHPGGCVFRIYLGEPGVDGMRGGISICS